MAINEDLDPGMHKQVVYSFCVMQGYRFLSLYVGAQSEEIYPEVRPIGGYANNSRVM